MRPDDKTLAFWHSARRLLGAIAVALAFATGSGPVLADPPADPGMPDEWFSLHGQITGVEQYHPPFTSPYRGTNSLDPGHRGDETVDATLFAGLRLADHIEAYVDPEIDQGFGLSDTLGIAGFPSGEAYKVGAEAPYVRLQRAFVRLRLGLGGAVQPIEPDQNQLGGTRSADRLTLTFGKFAVTDIFDDNDLAHDPRADFLNWSVIDAGAFDYPADAWGYTYGLAAEWTKARWTVRAGLFDLSRAPNSKALTRGLGGYSVLTEVEERHDLGGAPGALKILLFDNRGRMASYSDAIRAAAGRGAVPDVAAVRRFQSRPGASFNLQQQITRGLGVFGRASIADGSKETYEFTEIDRSLALGAAGQGKPWGRAEDTVGLALVVNAISSDARAYLAAGGLGIVIGDGRLPRYATERIAEVYYKFPVIDGVAVTADFQEIVNPAYNPDRGPVSVLGLRIHGEF